MKSAIARLFVFLIISSAYCQKNSPSIVLNSGGHSARIRSLLFNSDGNELLSLGEDKSILLWNVQSGELIKKVYTHIGEGPEGMIYTAAQVPSRNLLAISGYPVSQINDKGNYIVFYDLQSLEQINLISTDKGITRCIEFSNDGNYLAVGNEDGKVSIWSVKDVKNISKTAEFSVEGSINDISFAWDQLLLAVAYESKYFRIYDLNTLDSPLPSFTYKTVDKHYYPVNTVAFSPDSTYLVSGGNDHIINIYKTDGKFIKKVDVLPDPVSSVSFSLDGKVFVATTENSGIARSYSTGNFGMLAEFREHNNSISTTTISPPSEDGNFFVATAGGNDGEIFLWNPVNGKHSRILSGKGTAIWDIAFSENLELLISNQRNAERFEFVFDFATLKLKEAQGLRIASFNENHSTGMKRVNDYRVTISGKTEIINDPSLDGRILSFMQTEQGDVIIGSDFSLKRFTANGELRCEFIGHQGGIRSISTSQDMRYLATGGEDQAVHLWPFNENPEEKVSPFVSFFLTRDKEWVCWTPEGYFGCSDQGSQYFGWYLSNGYESVGDFFSAEQYFDVLYRPEDVKQSIINQSPISQIFDEEGEKVFDLSKMNKPSMALFENPYANMGSGRSIYLNKTRAKQFISDENEIILRVHAYDGGGGIKELRIYHNDKLISFERDVSTSQDRQRIDREFASQLLPGNNIFKVTAVNYQNVESRPDEIKIEYTGDLEAISDLHILSVGVNKYLNSNYDLNYAKNDAEAFLYAMESNAGNIFRNIHTTSIFDEQATAENIQSAFNKISEQAQLSDVFIFYYAGHGTIDQQSENNEYYLVPHDVVQLYGNSQELKQKAISANDLREMLTKVKAQKQLILLDACHSGGAVKALAMRGAPEEKAIVQLARSSGIVLISASGTKQYAIEFETLKHGAFTYVLLEGLGGEADGNKDQKITVNEIKAYMEDRVPQVTKEYGGTMQFPTGFSTGQDFPVSISIEQ